MIAAFGVLTALMYSGPPVRIAPSPPPPFILAHAEVDVDHDGAPDSISITMLAGEVKPGGCAGHGHLWTGRFVVTVSLAMGRSVSTYLNPLFGEEGDLTFFAPPWTLFVADYKRDGQPGFNLAEWSCHNNTAYHLFTVRPDGRVEPLCVEGSYSVGVFGDEASTADIKLTPEGFQTDQYDNSTPAGCTFFWGWNPARKQFDLLGRKCTPIP